MIIREIHSMFQRYVNWRDIVKIKQLSKELTDNIVCRKMALLESAYGRTLKRSSVEPQDSKWGGGHSQSTILKYLQTKQHVPRKKGKTPGLAKT